MREPRHPWPLMQGQDRESRRRCSKPRRQCELSGATTLLSLGYLFRHPGAPLKGHQGSLGPAFTSASLVRLAVRPAFALTLLPAFPRPVSWPLGPSDIFSEGCRPSQTAHQPLSSLSGVSIPSRTRWCYIGASTRPGSLISTAPTYAL